MIKKIKSLLLLFSKSTLNTILLLLVALAINSLFSLYISTNPNTSQRITQSNNPPSDENPTITPVSTPYPDVTIGPNPPITPTISQLPTPTVGGPQSTPTPDPEGLYYCGKCKWTCIAANPSQPFCTLYCRAYDDNSTWVNMGGCALWDNPAFPPQTPVNPNECIGAKNSAGLLCSKKPAPPKPTPIPTRAPTPVPVTSTPLPTYIVPTSPPSAITARLTFTDIILSGIGANSSIGENPTPLTNSRSFELNLYDQNGDAVRTEPFTVPFNTTGYSGSVSIPHIIPRDYTIKVRSNNSLWKSIPGVITLSEGNEPGVSVLNLVTGDIVRGDSSDNLLDLSDYNTLLSCISGVCSENDKKLSDLNDDGKVDARDLNILLRGYAVRRGE